METKIIEGFTIRRNDGLYFTTRGGTEFYSLDGYVSIANKMAMEKTANGVPNMFRGLWRGVNGEITYEVLPIKITVQVG